jgi:uncharacterized membrane protein
MEIMMLSKINKLNKPQYIFAFFSLIAGLILVFLIPPIGGIDENHHIRRTSEISQFILLHPKTHTVDRFSLWSDNAWVMRKNYHETNKPWHFDDIKLTQIDQPKEIEIAVEKNVLSLNSPIIYAPFAAALKIVNTTFAPEYWVQFYIVRVVALLCSVILLTMAIARIPEHKNLLAAAFLLPIMLYNRSGVNVDGIVIGCVSLFIVKIYNLSNKAAIISLPDKLQLGALSFLLAQCKGAYVPLLFLVLLIPKEKFSSKRNWIVSILLLIIPAIICGLGWSGYAKHEILSGIQYTTETTQTVWPDGQMTYILQNPIEFIGVLLKTVFASPLIPISIAQMIGVLGWSGFSIDGLSMVTVILLLIAISASEPVKIKLYNSMYKKSFLLLISSATIGLALTMLYVQWSPYQASIVSGFQGRYLYPLLPIFVIFAKPINEFASEKKANLLLWVFGLISSVSTIFATYCHYY